MSTFTLTAASTSTDPDGTIVNYAWNFGDGTTPPAHTYATAGGYQVTLIVTDNKGARNTSTQNVVAAPAPDQPPVAAFTSTQSNYTVTVNGSTSTDPDGTVASYAWNYGDGATDTGVMPAAHSYAAAGTYAITPTVTDNSGATNVLTQSVTVSNLPPVAAFTSASSGLALTVIGSASTDPDGSVASYAWD